MNTNNKQKKKSTVTLTLISSSLFCKLYEVNKSFDIISSSLIDKGHFIEYLNNQYSNSTNVLIAQDSLYNNLTELIEDFGLLFDRKSNIDRIISESETIGSYIKSSLNVNQGKIHYISFDQSSAHSNSINII
ncbi:hypothetical protein ACFLQ5_02410, partial [Bacteroidota bacterium]